MMKKTVSRSFLLTFLLLLMIINYSCAKGTYLKTESAPGIEGDKVLTVIFYGHEYLNNPVKAAILDIEGDEYTFEVKASGYEYSVERGVPVKEALKESQIFVSRHSYYLSSRFQKIVGGNGEIIGYELRPLYHSSAFGMSDILYLRYRIDDKKVIVSIDMKPAYRKKNFEKDDYSN